MLQNADLVAPEGFIYTDGEGVFASQIWLGEGVKADKFHLITKEEYETLTETEDIYADSL